MNSDPQVVCFTNAGQFLSRAGAFLLEREAENNLILGVTARLAGGEPAAGVGGADQPLFWVVEQQGRIVAAAMITPPHRLVLTRAPAPPIEKLCDQVWRTGVAVPGIMGEQHAARAFADRWCADGSVRSRLSHSLRAYQLSRVRPVAAAPGALGPATAEQVDLLVQWNEAFAREVHLLPLPTRQSVELSVKAGTRFIWRDGQPVSVAVAGSPTPSGMRIGAVYTPPACRRRGYATALVAALSQRQLDAGRRFCYLFTDLDNPTSNSIYQKIGYEPVCDFQEYDFTAGH